MKNLSDVLTFGLTAVLWLIAFAVVSVVGAGAMAGVKFVTAKWELWQAALVALFVLACVELFRRTLRRRVKKSRIHYICEVGCTVLVWCMLFVLFVTAFDAVSSLVAALGFWKSLAVANLILAGVLTWRQSAAWERPEIKLMARVEPFTPNGDLFSVQVRNAGSIAVFLKDVRLAWIWKDKAQNRRLIPVPSRELNDDPLEAGAETTFFLAPNPWPGETLQEVFSQFPKYLDDRALNSVRELMAMVEGLPENQTWVAVFSPAQEVLRVEGREIVRVAREIIRATTRRG